MDVFYDAVSGRSIKIIEGDSNNIVIEQRFKSIEG